VFQHPKDYLVSEMNMYPQSLKTVYPSIWSHKSPTATNNLHSLLILNPQSRSEPEIQSLVSLVRRGIQVMHALFSSHGIPFLVSTLVLQLIIGFRADEENDVPSHQTQKHLVTTVVVRFVVRAVDLRGDNGACLNGHVIKRRGDCSRSHCTSIARSEGDQHGVSVGVSDNERGDSPFGPVGVREGLWEHFESDEQRQDPDLRDKSDDHALVDLFR